LAYRITETELAAKKTPGRSTTITAPVDFSYLLHYKHGNQPCSGINMQKAKVRGRA
jgi:hypothetical protein